MKTDLKNLAELSEWLRLPQPALLTLLQREDAPAPFLELGPNYRVYSASDIQLWLEVLKENREGLIAIAEMTKPDQGRKNNRRVVLTEDEIDPDELDEGFQPLTELENDNDAADAWLKQRGN